MTYEEKLKIGQDSYDAFNQKDIDALLRLYDPECEWHMSNYHGWPERSVYRGHQGLTDFFDTWLEPWEDFHIELKELIDLPGDRGYGIGHGRGHGRSSGAAVELPPLAQISEFRGGRLLRVDNYSDIEEARMAAGLPGKGVTATPPDRGYRLERTAGARSRLSREGAAELSSPRKPVAYRVAATPIGD